jgi:ring-1,2-phenylacetyl-CoA epoxidase subunit PaaD
MAATAAEVWTWLDAVPDPEIPVISVVDLGIVRDVAWVPGDGGSTLKVTITPTYSGCPASRVIERDIEAALREHGVERVALDVRLAPPWTTDWLSLAGRQKLRAYGIAPPERAAAVACPRCASFDVETISWFGSTPCKALYRCKACREPFDHFKCH